MDSCAHAQLLISRLNIYVISMSIIFDITKILTFDKVKINPELLLRLQLSGTDMLQNIL